MRLVYLLNSFPNTSETFISDEIFSLDAIPDLSFIVIALESSRNQIVHPRASQIVESGRVTYLNRSSAANDLRDALYLLKRHPLRVVATAIRALPQRQSWWQARNALRFAAMVDRQNGTHVHSHYADNSTQVAMWIRRLTGVPYTFTTHGYDIFFHPPENLRELASEAKKVLCVSHFNAEFVANTYGIDRSKIDVVRCGIFVEDFPFVHRHPVRSRSQIRLLNVGRLVPEKGQNELLKCMRMLLLERQAVRLTIVGDGPLMDALLNQATSLGILEYVDFVGAKSGPDVRALMQDCDIFVLSSVAESMPIVLMEAMASGIPVIATSVRGVSELVEHMVTGVLCRPSDPKGLVDAVSWILNHPDENALMVASARQRVAIQFDRARCTEDLLRIIDSDCKR